MRLRSNYNEALAIKEHFRDEFDCGLCEHQCRCGQGKYGAPQYFAGDCGVASDQHFLFGRPLLARLRLALRQYFNVERATDIAIKSPSRMKAARPGKCLSHGGTGIESGWSRILEDLNVTARGLRFRTQLVRMFDGSAFRGAGWNLLSLCIFTWGSRPVPCSSGCGMTHAWLRSLGLPEVELSPVRVRGLPCLCMPSEHTAAERGAPCALRLQGGCNVHLRLKPLAGDGDPASATNDEFAGPSSKVDNRSRHSVHHARLHSVAHLGMNYTYCGPHGSKAKSCERTAQ